MQIQLTGFATAPVDGVVTFLKPGLVYDVDGAYAERLVASGVAFDIEGGELPVSEVESDAADAGAEEASEDTAEEASDEASDGLARPAKSDPVAKWQDYARSLGIDPKGMTKQELIAKFS